MLVCLQEEPCISGGNRRENAGGSPSFTSLGAAKDKTLCLPVWLGESADLLQHEAMLWEEAFPRPISGSSQAQREAGGEETATNPGHAPQTETTAFGLGRLGVKLSSSLLVLSAVP